MKENIQIPLGLKNYFRQLQLQPRPSLCSILAYPSLLLKGLGNEDEGI